MTMNERFRQEHPDVAAAPWCSKFTASKDGEIVEAWEKRGDEWVEVTALVKAREELRRLQEDSLLVGILSSTEEVDYGTDSLLNKHSEEQ